MEVNKPVQVKARNGKACEGVANALVGTILVLEMNNICRAEMDIATRPILGLLRGSVGYSATGN